MKKLTFIEVLENDELRSLVDQIEECTDLDDISIKRMNVDILAEKSGFVYSTEAELDAEELKLYREAKESGTLIRIDPKLEAKL